MQRARILGQAVATVKHPSMNGFRLLVGQPLDPHDGPDGDPILIVDTLGAGVGANVVVSSDGKAATTMLNSKQTPVRWFTLGIEDAKG